MTKVICEARWCINNINGECFKSKIRINASGCFDYKSDTSKERQ